jgi:CBS domain-containing protein
MRARYILEGKGHDVATVTPDTTVRDAVAELARHNIGALIVSSDGLQVAGILSERDVVRRLGTDGAAVLERPVADIMKSQVRTCTLDDQTGDLMEMMTTGRFRHIPVMDEGRLVGIISIGDVVKVRIDELATEREQLTEYIAHG